MTAFRSALVLAAAVAGATLLVAGASAAANYEVHLKNAAFVPSTLQVQPHDNVTFINDDSFAHDVLFDAGFGTGAPGSLAAGANWSVEIGTEGHYAYHCQLHTTMTGLITSGNPPPRASTPGFEMLGALSAVLAVALVARRRRA